MLVLKNQNIYSSGALKSFRRLSHVVCYQWLQTYKMQRHAKAVCVCVCVTEQKGPIPTKTNELWIESKQF